MYVCVRCFTKIKVHMYNSTKVVHMINTSSVPSVQGVIQRKSTTITIVTAVGRWFVSESLSLKNEFNSQICDQKNCSSFCVAIVNVWFQAVLLVEIVCGIRVLAGYCPVC